MKFITATDLKSKIDQGEQWQMIDVREPYEREICSINSCKIPMAEIESNLEQINKIGNVAIFCKSGNRSKAIVNLLESEYNYTNVYSLEGGITAWASEVDNSLEVY